MKIQTQPMEGTTTGRRHRWLQQRATKPCLMSRAAGEYKIEHNIKNTKLLVIVNNLR